MAVIVGDPSEFSCRQQQMHEHEQERRGNDKRQDDLDQRDHGALRSARAAAARRSGRTAGPVRRDRRASNRRSWRAPLKPLTGIGVTDACHEEAEAERQHQDVQHGMFLCDVNREPNDGDRVYRARGATRRIGFRGGRDGDFIGIS